MPTYVFSATESSFVQDNAPSREEIIAALQSVSPPAGVSASWVSPTPRITREQLTPSGASALTWLVPGYAFGGRDAKTHVAAVFIVNADQATGDQAAQQIAAAANAALAGIPNSNWAPGSVTGFNPSLNGSLAQWQDGSASQTQTSVQFPSSIAENENAIGPTTRATVPQTFGQALGDQAAPAASVLGDVTKFLLIAGGFAVAGVGLFYAWPWLSGARSVKTTRQRLARGNPSRYRMRRVRRARVKA